jgi:carboxyl-terminal processing protease
VNVVNVVPNGPSDRAGVEVGDQIIKVNDTASLTKKNISSDDIKKLLRGPGGSTVKVTVVRTGSLKSFIIKRGVIPVPSVDVAYMIAPQTGFIRINKFAETTYAEFMEALQKLQKQGMQKLILDLRGNGGGYLDQAVNIADEFLDGNKLIVYTQGAHAERKEYRCSNDGIFEHGKLAVLVDETTASASEILSGALQDWDRATLIGRRTFGKGLVQEQFNLTGGSALRLTIARYYTPVGRNIQKPYNKGKEEYEEELVNRFHDGEVVIGDTAKPLGKAFKTPSGRLVYGGGGITPDIFVPYDTSAQPKPILELYVKGIITNYIYNYYRSHSAMFQTVASPQAFSKVYVAGEKDWQALEAMAKKDSVDISHVPDTAKREILNKMTAYLAREKWRAEGFFEISNENDPMVKKALEVLK